MYWIHVPHLSQKGDKYGFADEGEIRIATGVMLMFVTLSLFLVAFKAEFTIPLVLVSIMWCDFVLKVFLGPKYSLFGSIVRLWRRNSAPIWIGAVQKRFAWSIGLFLSSFTIYCLLLLGEHISPMAWGQAVTVGQVLQGMRENIANNTLFLTPMNGGIFACLLCLVFMWLESIVGYCVGCHIYGWLVRKWWMKAHRWQNCVDNSCEVN